MTLTRYGVLVAAVLAVFVIMMLIDDIYAIGSGYTTQVKD